MREYLLYVKEEKQRGQAYVTPCYAVDQLFWEQQDGIRLHIIGRTPSLALAFLLREKVNQLLSASVVTGQLMEDLRHHTAGVVREVNELYMPDTESYSFSFQRVRQSSVLDEAPVHGRMLKELMQAADKLYDRLHGRALLWDEIIALFAGRWEGDDNHADIPSALEVPLHWLVLQGKAVWQPGVRLEVKRGLLRHRIKLACMRCGSTDGIEPTQCHSCLQGCAYCTGCIQFGRSKCCTPFICLPGKKGTDAPFSRRLLAWNGQYTPRQAEVAERAREYVATGSAPSFLIWAVCGAGKTELIFPAIAHVLEQGERVLLATPRKDVVLELLPRLRAAFPDVRIIAMHGSSMEKWLEAELVIATTHQVIRCYQRFALVIIDEVDAFPYHNNPLLYRAVQRSIRPGGKCIYLSATPPESLRRALVKRSWVGMRLHSPTHVMLPIRYHGNPLPVPAAAMVPGLSQKLLAGRPIAAINHLVSQTLSQGRKLFLFVPRVADVAPVLTYLSSQFPADAGRITGVHAADPRREEKVQQFRAGDYSVLVTTTILERGVTIPASDVMVLYADHRVFDRASLVQIAGRVGRSAAFPDGTVLFVMERRAKGPAEAIREIKRMNRLADTGRRGRCG